MADLGSDTWLKADDLEEDSDLHTRATNFFAAVRWDKVVRIASQIRGKECNLSGNYSIGYYNLVRRLTFEDGVNWIIRLRLPDLQSVLGTREAMKASDCTAIEVATMNYLLLNTNIPVPEVFACDLTHDNIVGAPYIFMSYIHGTVAKELQETRGCQPGVFGTPEQNERFWRQMAGYHVQLASLTFDKIGSLQQQGDQFFIGPEIETGEGPWSSSQEYYTALVRHKMRVAETDAEPEVRDSNSFSFPLKLTELMQKVEAPDTGRFGLANRDFGAHNVLVDSDFNIVGLIDFDGVMAAPSAVIAQLPQLMDMWRLAPGHVETRELALARQAKTAHLLPKYAALVKLATIQQQSKSEQEDVLELAPLLTSDAASVLQGLNEFGQHREFVNDRWMAAYNILLHQQ